MPLKRLSKLLSFRRSFPANLLFIRVFPPAMQGTKLWNDLPIVIRNKPSVNAFKNALKTPVFQKEFPS